MKARALIRFGFHNAILVAILMVLMLAAVIFTTFLAPGHIAKDIATCLVNVMMALIALLGGIVERTLRNATRVLGSSKSSSSKLKANGRLRYSAKLRNLVTRYLSQFGWILTRRRRGG